jgi:hypothetical protein
MLRPIIALALMLACAGVPAIAKKSGGGDPCCAETGGCKAGKNGKTPAAGSMYQITVSQSGGIAGIHKELTIDSSKLKKQQQQKLADLVAATGILKVESEKKVTRGAADMFIYEFKIECCGKTHLATFDEGTLPEAYRSLRGYLNEVQPKNK